MREPVPKEILGLGEEIEPPQENTEQKLTLGEIENGLKYAEATGRLLEKAYWEDAKEKYIKAEGGTETTTTKKEGDEKKAEYEDLREYLKYEQRELSAPIIQEARQKRDQILEARGLLQMSKTDFDTYFKSNEFDVSTDLKQKNVGDCYAIAAIHAMSRSPHFEMICRSSMKRLPDGSWEVKIPLLSEHGETITITPEELLPQKNRQFLKRKEKGGIMPDLRRKLMPVEGKEGLRVLEAAFIKQGFGSVDRLAAENGFGDEALLSLGGDNFRKYTVYSEKYSEETKTWEYPGLKTLSGESRAYLDHYLENFDPEIHIATVSTKGNMGKVTGFYRARGTKEFLVPNHAYSISDVDRKKGLVSIVNPWDTSESINLTFDQFRESFSGLSAIRIDSAKLLNNMEGVENRESNIN